MGSEIRERQDVRVQVPPLVTRPKAATVGVGGLTLPWTSSVPVNMAITIFWLIGITNGVDYDVWDPATDPHLTAHYSAEDLTGKRECKLELLRRFVRRYRAVVTVTAVALVLLATLGAESFRQVRSERARPIARERQELAADLKRVLDDVRDRKGLAR